MTFTSEPAERAVNVDDGGAWVFRAPAGTTVKRMQIWRNTATAESVDDAGTGGVENGWWTLYARAGDQVAGRVVLAAETCPGNTPTPPDPCAADGGPRTSRPPCRSPTTSASPS